MYSRPSQLFINQIVYIRMFVVTYSSTGPRKRFREMIACVLIAAHGGGHGKGFPALSYPELF